MGRYALKRIAWSVPTFIGITLVTFAVIHLAPGDPALSGMTSPGDTAMTSQTYVRLRSQFHLDDPLPIRYLRWVGGLLRFDFGNSFHDGQPVAGKVGGRLVPTLVLVGVSLGFSLLLAVPLGLVGAMHAGGWFDRLLGGACFGLYAVPRYVMASVLIALVGVRLGWAPFVGITSTDYAELSAWGKVLDLLKHNWLIGVCYAYPLIAYQTRFVRASALVVLGEDYIRTARAKGAGELRVAFWHVLPNVLVPLLTLVGLMLPAVVGGSVILEVMFSWPGMGRLLFDAILQRDYPVVMALAVLSAVVVLFGTLVVDLLYALVDPRVRSR